MKNVFFIFPLLISFIIICTSCSSNNENGILGIEVPIGKGKVSESTPYLVSGVYENSPAYKAGIRPGDLIIQINDMPVSNGMIFDDIFSKQLTGKPGTKVTIYVKRGAESFVFEIIRAERGN